eukprot:TRINITY_DN16317_c0_g1_i1.p1 TRINITY_DN16317_c0_g1~~TRINITY_DN16317_c0_g1_i1.p1  ORF type:complete len:215 (-),score=66.87 TRINITY_DN16317_c0_g1_i1:332-976(-)
MALAGMSEEFKKKQALFFNQQHSGLLDVTEEVAAWTEELVKQENFVITSKPVEYLETVRTDLKWDHMNMKKALVRLQLMDSTLWFLPALQRDGERNQLCGIWRFGESMVGHPHVTHGGAIAFAFDESFGVLFASAFAYQGVLGMTANLSVDYKKPFPANKHALLRARVENVERRKVFMKATLQDGPSGAVYAESKALFIILKDPPPQPAKQSEF